MFSERKNIFGDLPDVFINELLTRADVVGKETRDYVDTQMQARESLRKRAHQLGLIKKLPDLTNMPTKSVAAVDGSLVTRQLASFDLNAAAALAVDGIGFESDEPSSWHEIAIHTTKPLPSGQEITYALMFCMEYEVAHKVERDLVMLDGAFSTGMVAISIAWQSSKDLKDTLSEVFKCRWTESTMGIVPELLDSDNVISVPKRSSLNEFVTQTKLFDNREVNTNGRSTASLILEAGEYAGPFKLETHSFHFDSTEFYSNYITDLCKQYSGIRVLYYKPKDWTHALRIELPPGIANDHKRTAESLEIIRMQTVNPAIMEPYPLYVADRFVKSLNKGVDALLDSVKTKIIAESEEPDLVFGMLNSYRTDVTDMLARELGS